YGHVMVAGGVNPEQARRLPWRTSATIALAAAQGVLTGVGVPVDEVDAIFGDFCGEIAYQLGLPAVSISGSGSKGIAAVLEAAQAIAARACDVALVVAGGAGHYADREATAPWTRPANEWVASFGLITAAEFALIARRHMAMYGTTPEQMAVVAATIRNNGHVNPEAVYYGRGPFTAEDVLASRMIADPFRLLDCATTSEGGCALLMTTPERAADLPYPGVRILGGNTDRMGPLYQYPPAWDLTAARVDAPPNGYVGRRAAQHAFKTAGLRPQDVDVCEFYDPFSFEIIRQFEAFGFCAEGEGGEFVMNGRIALGG